jgi:hypothetical protein
MQRRRVLQAIAAGTALGVAGCTGGGDRVSGDAATRSPSPTPEDGTGGTGDGSDGSAPSEEATATPTEEATATPTEEATGDSAGPTLASLDVSFEDNYRFSISGPQMDAPITGAFDGENFFSVVTADGETITTYVVEGETYFVADGTCTQVPGSEGTAGEVNVESLADADSVEQDVTGSGSASLRPSGTTTIDGTRMYVYELEDGDTTATYYIGVESRRLRRVESQGTVIDYTDWGSVEPITAPC